jgi:hypothetical protein
VAEPLTGRRGAAAKAAPREFFCRNCRRKLWLAESRLPHGWYQVTVGVPEFMEAAQGKGYLWVGAFCSAWCLVEYAPTLEKEEELARQAYEPEVPS